MYSPLSQTNKVEPDQFARMLKQAWWAYQMKAENYRVSPNEHTKVQMEIRRRAVDIAIQVLVEAANNRAVTAKRG